jgi:hypothetical protein
MSVIAKMNVRGQTDFGTGRLVELGCVCENDLMAAYAKSEEDRLFTKYSPWGAMKLSQPPGWALGNAKEADDFSPAPAFYVMALHESEHKYVEPLGDGYTPDRNFPGASAWVFGVCHVVSNFGSTAHVEFRGSNSGTGKGRAVEKLNWKMSVDNPGASNQFKPGERYWIVLYAAEKFDRDAAIAAAHGHVEVADETLAV